MFGSPGGRRTASRSVANRRYPIEAAISRHRLTPYGLLLSILAVLRRALQRDHHDRYRNLAPSAGRWDGSGEGDISATHTCKREGPYRSSGGRGTVTCWARHRRVFLHCVDREVQANHTYPRYYSWVPKVMAATSPSHYSTTRALIFYSFLRLYTM